MALAVQRNQSQLVFLGDSSQVMNEPRDITFFLATLPILVVAVTVNIWAGVEIGRKENTGINNLIVWDCVINALSMSFDTFYINSPWSILRSLPPCAILIFAHQLLVAWNRLVPVAIVVFRYMMVCHAVFCHNMGGEKTVWRTVMTAFVVICLVNPLLVVFNISDSLVFLWCMGRQEAFR